MNFKTTLGSDYSGSHIYLGLLYDNKKVATTVDIDMTYPKRGADVIRELLNDWYSNYGVNKIWAEEAWVNGMRFPKSGMQLSRMSGFLELIALDSGYKIEFVHPMTWRKTVYGHARPPNPKNIAMTYVKNLFDWQPKFKKDHNLAESILLAHYGALKDGN